MKSTLCLWMAILLTSCGSGQPRDANGVTDSSAIVEFGQASPDSAVLSHDTIDAPSVATGFWAVVSSQTRMVPVSAPDDLRPTLDSLKVEGFHGRKRLFSTWLEGGNTIISSELVAVASDGSLWIIHSVEQSWAEAAGSNIRTICLDGQGKEIQGLAPEGSSYLMKAITQVNADQLVEGGHVLDLRARVWTNLERGPGVGNCSDFIGENALLVLGRQTEKAKPMAFFYSLPDLKMRLSFPCDCSGEDGSMEEDIFYQNEASAQSVTLGDRERNHIYKVDLVKWLVDSTTSR